MDTFLAYVGAYVFHCDISSKRVKIFIDFQEAEILSNQRRNEADIDLLKSEVLRLTTENTRLKEELDMRTSELQMVIQQPPLSIERSVRSKNSPVKVPRNSNKSPEEAENSEPHANTIPAPKRTKVQNTSISNPRSTRTRTKNT